MINKSRKAGKTLCAIFAMLTAPLACSVGERGDGGYQGVIELEERTLGFEVGGRVSQLGVDRGTQLKVATPIARLDATLEEPARDLRAAELGVVEADLALLRAGTRSEEIRATEASLRAAEASERLLGRNLTRERELIASGASTTMRVDDLETQLARARAERESLREQLRAQRGGARAQQIAAAEARLVAAKSALLAQEERLERFALHAQHPGRVLDVHVKPGEVIAPGAPVVTVADTQHPFVDVFVPQGDVAGLRIGLAARVFVDAEARAFTGRVEDIGRKTEFTPRYLFSERERPNLVVRVRVRIDDPQERLHAGVPAFAKFEGR